MPSDCIQIAIATDANYAMQTGVLLASLASVHSDEKILVSVICDGLSVADRQRLERSAGASIPINFIDMAEVLSAADLVGIQMPARLPNASVARLALAEVLVDQERAIYLDADTLTLRSLRPLWEHDLGAVCTGAVRDGAFPWLATGVDWRPFSVPPDASYFNSGVLLISLDGWRGIDIKSRALRLLRDNSFRFDDQCALNLVLQSEWVALPPVWNVQSAHLGEEKAVVWASEGSRLVDAAKATPAVVHFHGPAQNPPWEPDCGNPFGSRIRNEPLLVSNDLTDSAPVRRVAPRPVGRL